MGLLTWILIAVVILAIIGIGWQTFISGIFKGAKKLGITPITPTIKNMTEKTKQYIANVTKGS
jgi:hypothetical protein